MKINSQKNNLNFLYSVEILIYLHERVLYPNAKSFFVSNPRLEREKERVKLITNIFIEFTSKLVNILMKPTTTKPTPTTILSFC
jgi:hypothetical protein